MANQNGVGPWSEKEFRSKTPFEILSEYLEMYLRSTYIECGNIIDFHREVTNVNIAEKSELDKLTWYALTRVIGRCKSRLRVMSPLANTRSKVASTYSRVTSYSLCFSQAKSTRTGDPGCRQLSTPSL